MKKTILGLVFLVLSASAYATHYDICYYKNDGTLFDKVDTIYGNLVNIDEQTSAFMAQNPEVVGYTTMIPSGAHHGGNECPIYNEQYDNHCGEPGSVNNCESGTTHTAGHTLNIHMGGFQDGLYVCKVEVTGHLCDLDDANVDADVLTDAQGNLLGDGKSYTFPKPAMTSNGTTDNQSSELHLNSFRFGSMYRVTYCYDYRRATSRRVTNQEGLLTGSMAANTALDDYAAIAGVSATLDWSCSDTLGTVAAAAAPVTYNALDNSANNTLDVLAIFPDLGISQTGSCVFTVDFVEDGNVGAIRPVHATNVDGITHGTIDTDVNLSMDLIQN